jgi:hypothetical protein
MKRTITNEEQEVLFCLIENETNTLNDMLTDKQFNLKKDEREHYEQVLLILNGLKEKLE